MIYEEITKNKIKSALLILLFVAIVVALGFFFSYAFSFGIPGLILAIFIALVISLIGYYSGDKIALSMSSAKPADKKNYAYYHNAVEGLAIAAGIPKPELYIIPSKAINAFATGRDPKHSSIAVTEGALEKLSRTELEGVLAHEISHIKNYDIRIMMLTGVLIGIVVIISDFILRSWLWRGNDERKGNLGLILLIIGIALAILSPIIANLINLAVSRRREYLADASGALLTRYPKGLADALRKIKKDTYEIKTSSATAHLFISNPFKGKSISHLFSTHPPIEERIRRLDAM